MDPRGYVETSSRRWSGHKLASRNHTDLPSPTTPTYMPLTDPSNGPELKRQLHQHHKRSAKSTDFSNKHFFSPYSPGRTVSAPQILQHKRSSSLGTVLLKNAHNYYSYPSLKTPFESPRSASSSIASSSSSSSSNRRPSKTVHFESTNADKARAKRNRHSIAVSPSEIKPSLRQSSALFPSKEFSEETLDRKKRQSGIPSPAPSPSASSLHQNAFTQTFSPPKMAPLSPYLQDNRQPCLYPHQQQPFQQPQQPHQQSYLHPIQTNNTNASYVYGSPSSYFAPQPMQQNPCLYKSYSAPTFYGAPMASTPQSPALPVYGGTWQPYPLPPISSRVPSSTASNQEMSNLYSTYPKRRVSNSGSVSAGSSHSSSSSSESSSSESSSSSTNGGGSSSSSNSSGTSFALEQPKIPLRMRAGRIKAQQHRVHLPASSGATEDNIELGTVHIFSPRQISNSSNTVSASDILQTENRSGEHLSFARNGQNEEKKTQEDMWQPQKQQLSVMPQSQLQRNQHSSQQVLLCRRIPETHFLGGNPPTASKTVSADVASSLFSKVENIALQVSSQYAALNNAPPLLQVAVQFVVFFILLDFLVNVFVKFGFLPSMNLLVINIVIASTVWAFFIKDWEMRHQKEMIARYKHDAHELN